jgi:hypothetical protein
MFVELCFLFNEVLCSLLFNLEKIIISRKNEREIQKNPERNHILKGGNSTIKRMVKRKKIEEKERKKERTNERKKGRKTAFPLS